MNILIDDEVPHVYTVAGHVPADALMLRTDWEDTPDYTKCTVNYFRKSDGAFVRNDVYAYSKRGLSAEAVAAEIPH